MRNTLAALGASLTLALGPGCTTTVQNHTNESTSQIMNLNGQTTLVTDAATSSFPGNRTIIGADGTLLNGNDQIDGLDGISIRALTPEENEKRILALTPNVSLGSAVKNTKQVPADMKKLDKEIKENK